MNKLSDCNKVKLNCTLELRDNNNNNNRTARKV